MAPVTSTLALQGGASFGAYTWGVLDALLEDGRLEFEGVTGASAGAINAVALAAGMASGGPDAARRSLRAFWEALADAAERRRRRRRLASVWAVLGALRGPDSMRAFFDLTNRIAADFEIDPETMQPLRGVLDATIDFEKLRAAGAPRVFVNATDVRTRAIRVFSAGEITTDAVCASCCVPLLFAPVAIGNDHYWDGCFLGNPAIYPVLYECESSDVVLVETRPREGLRPPRSPRELLSRVVDLSATAGLARELRMIDFVSELVRQGQGDGRLGHLREVRVHRIDTPPALAELEGAGSFRADRAYFQRLCELGREAARIWLEQSFAAGFGQERGAERPSAATLPPRRAAT
jgi:NTE family protein